VSSGVCILCWQLALYQLQHDVSTSNENHFLFGTDYHSRINVSYDDGNNNNNNSNNNTYKYIILVC
jgi:hypothetical protein